MHIFISKVVNQVRIYNFTELFKWRHGWGKQMWNTAKWYDIHVRQKVLKFIIMFSYFIYIVLKLKNKYSFFFFFFFFIFNPLCRRTIRQYVEQVLRLCTVLVFLSPFDFVHIHTVKSYPHTLSIQILLYTAKILQFVRLLLKVNYKNRIA
jgi:hypothetical protein